MGVQISIASVTAVWLILSLVLWTLLRISNVPLRTAGVRTGSGEDGPRTLPRLALAATGVLIGLSFLLSVGRAQAGWDAMAIWSAKGYGIALEGSIQAGRHWGEHGLSYPLNIPVLVSFFALFDGDLLPGSKLIFPPFYASLVIGGYFFWRRQGLSRSISSLGVVALASLPIVYDHATLGDANLPEACYLTLGLLYTFEGTVEDSRGALLAGGLLLGLATWTRPEGALLAVVGVAGLMISLRLSRAGQIRVGTWLIPVLVLSGSWLVFAGGSTGGSQFGGVVSHAWNRWMEGQLNLGAVREVAAYSARQAVDPSVWGVAAPLFLLLVWIGRQQLSVRARSATLPILLTGLIIGVAVLGYYYLTSFSGPPLDWWLSTGLNRTAIPSVCLLLVGAFLAAGGNSTEVEPSVLPR
jgi:hypothetical protein